MKLSNECDKDLFQLELNVAKNLKLISEETKNLQDRNTEKLQQKAELENFGNNIFMVIQMLLDIECKRKSSIEDLTFEEQCNLKVIDQLQQIEVVQKFDTGKRKNQLIEFKKDLSEILSAITFFETSANKICENYQVVSNVRLEEHLQQWQSILVEIFRYIQEVWPLLYKRSQDYEPDIQKATKDIADCEAEIEASTNVRKIGVLENKKKELMDEKEKDEEAQCVYLDPMDSLDNLFKDLINELDRIRRKSVKVIEEEEYLAIHQKTNSSGVPSYKIARLSIVDHENKPTEIVHPWKEATEKDRAAILPPLQITAVSDRND